MAGSTEPEATPLPDALLSRNPLRLLPFFGPGAIIASLTIGTGELIFSSRGGAIFGYRVLWLFLFISILKWGLVYATSRHMVLSGAHPFERWLHLPGPRGWFPILMLLTAIPCYPMWVSLHSSVIGTMGSWLLASHPSPHVVGAIVLAAVVILVVAGGYKTLERVQLLIVGLMLLSVMISLVLLNPDWLALLEGMFIPRALNYPDWLATAAPDIAKRPVWVETAVYVSVIGGASYDYLVYVSFLRDKRWGFAGSPVSSRETLDIVAADPNHPARRWVRAARFDTVASFVAIVVFSMVFVAMGAQILGPEHQIPNKDNMLNLQEQFLTTLHAGLWPLYVLGAGLTMVGTLYGTIEMSTYVAQEVLRAVDPHGLGSNLARIRRITIAWSVSGAFALLALNHVQENVNLIEFITPATLFTGLLSCGFVCLLAPWADRRFLPAALRMNRPLAALNGVSGLIFLGLGIKSYWDYAANPNQNAMVTATAVAGFVIAVVLAFAWGARLGLRYRQSH